MVLYSLFLSVLPPLGPRAAVAGAPAEHAGKTNSPIKVPQDSQKPRWRGGEVLARFPENLPAADVAVLLNAHGIERAGRLRGQSGVVRLRLAAGANPEDAAAALRASGKVEFAEPNYLITADQVSPSDPRFPEQWALRNEGAAGGQFGSDINATQGWGLSTGSPQTVVAVLDSGVDFTHPELVNNEWANPAEMVNGLDDDRNGFTDDLRGWDFVSNSAEVRDVQGHGTAVAGIIAAEGNNGAGITGVMWRAGLMSLRVLDETGTGDIAAAAEAIDYAVTKGAQVINCSWGTDDSSTVLLDAIRWASRRGVVVVVSAGNDGRDVETAPRYPASFYGDNLIVVASTDNSDQLAAWANWGASHVTVSAPGVDVLTTGVGGAYQAISGSSASTPIVSGVVGLIKTLRPWLSAAQTRAMIVRGARRVPTLSDKVFAGGVVSAAGSLVALDTLPPDEGLDSSNGNNGGGHEQDTATHTRPGLSGGMDDGEFTMTPPGRMSGAPRRNLPNLDELRTRQPTQPEAHPPVPSDRCSHRTPNCHGRAHARGVASGARLRPDQMLAWNLELPDVGGLLKNVSGLVSDSTSPLALFAAAPEPLAPPLPPTIPVEDVVWVNAAGVMITDGSLKKTLATGLWNAGASSSKSIGAGDGYVEFSTGEVNTSKMCGLNVGSTSHSYTEINFALNPRSDGTIYIYESGTPRSQGGSQSFGTYVAGDLFRVAVEGGFVKYYKNTTLLYTSNVTPTYPLLADTSLYTTGATVTDTVISGMLQGKAPAEDVVWTNDHGVTPSGNDLTKYEATAWGNAGAVSVQTVPFGDCYVEWTASETNLTRMIGLGTGDSNQSSSDIAFGIQMNAAGILYVIESGSNRGNFGAYSTGDRLRVSVLNRVVKYWKNGVLLYESGLSPVYPLLVDTALYSTGSTITDAVLSHELNNEQGGPNYDAARLDPLNRTGRSGVDMLSRNINWSLPLLNLAGRAGLDLGLSLSYNSLVWTRAGTTITFDADSGTPSPGFRLGFPVIQAPYFNSETNTNAYLLITPSGSRVELRQVGTSKVYEAGDSSYLQLTDNGNATLLLKDTGGTQYFYSLYGGEYHCTQVKDRNGNYLSVAYHPDGRIDTITDTLARTITFNYDATYNSLTSITQTWTVNGVTQTHKWATFGWGNETIDTSFSTLTVVGPENGTSIRVLQWVSLPDGTSYHFDYSTRLQVTTVTRKYAYGATTLDDDKTLSYRSYILAASASECPRPTQQKVWAKDWNGDDDGVPAAAEEATTIYTFSIGASGEAKTPDNTRQIELFDTTSGWKKGLTTGTQVKIGTAVLKATAITWTQDDEALTFQKNPRPTAITITDNAGNSRKTTISYYTDPVYSFSLPEIVEEYAADGNAVLRRTQTTYNPATVYKTRHIIGLPGSRSVSQVNGATTTLVSKVTYEYDEGGDFFVDQGTTTNHDAAGYPATFSLGRGNQTGVRRWNVQYPTDGTKAVESNIGYNNSGSIILTRNALGRQTTFDYTDSFSDTTKSYPNTLAYPTKVTPPVATGETAASFALSTQYNYDFGAVTLTQGPAPAGQTAGPIQTVEYDSAGRVSKVKSLTNNAYTTWVYGSDGTVSTNTLTLPGQLAFATTLFDGEGRAIVTASDNSATAGDYRGRAFYYDVMGRLSEQSNPAKVNSSWEPSGEDGSLWTMTSQAYDWKGRPTLTTNPDGTTQLLSYGGCGCAGGEVVTDRDEMGRLTKFTSDVLGRTVKTEVMSWADGSGNRTLYSSRTMTYNALDQITEVVERAEPSGPAQTATVEYDGHGRAWKKRAPGAAGPTIIEYFADDSVKKLTDARTATTNFTYNVRAQVTGVSYTAPSGVAVAASASFIYDAAGNRTSMTDEFGTVDYQYDALSQMLSESRQFTSVTNPTSGSGGKYTLTYTYTLSGIVKSITDPFGERVDYASDKVGQVTGVTGTSFAGVTQYASQIKYRAWGAAKEITYGDGLKATLSYNQRLTPSQYDLKDASNVLQMGAAYQYYSDGRLKFADDLREPRFDRQFKYDHVGRVTEAESGYLARDAAYPGSDSQNGPYNHYYGYDQFGHLTSRTGAYWYRPSGETYTATYLNNLNQNSGWLYDADGRVTQSQVTGSSPSYPYTQTYTNAYTYDAAGRRTDSGKYDGDGRNIKSADGMLYYVRSSVLRGLSVSEVFSELQSTTVRGKKSSTFVFLGGEAIAEQHVSYTSGSAVEQLKWKRYDPSQTSVHIHDDSGLPSSTGGMVQRAVDLQGISSEAPDYTKLQQDPSYYNQSYNSYNYGASGYGPGGGGLGGYSSSDSGMTGGVPGNFGSGCMLNGSPIPCDFASQLINGGGVVPCPNNNCDTTIVHDSQGNPVGVKPFDPSTVTVNGTLGGWVNYTTNWTTYEGEWGKRVNPETGEMEDTVLGGTAHTLTTSLYFPSLDSARFPTTIDPQRGRDNGEYKRELSPLELLSLTPIILAVVTALENPACSGWVGGNTPYNPTAEFGNLLANGHFFYGGRPGSYATTYLGQGAPSFSWIGLRKAFFDSPFWEKVNTILHELRHAVYMGDLLHPEDFKSDSAQLDHLRRGGLIETQASFNRDVEQNCIGPLKSAMRGR
ncbi:MAG TPA: S8 family serine peptidase [Pyrinomonadaceae bacterium]|jgi:YD repeat-containing protein